MLDELRELYQEVILDHGKNPRNFRKPDDANRQALGRNPLCGDQLAIYVTVDGEETIRDAGFVGKGCAISMASASLMTEIVKDKTVADAKALFDRFHRMCTEDDAAEEMAAGDAGGDADLERLEVLSGVRQFPVRVKCATLAWHAMSAALDGDEEISTET